METILKFAIFFFWGICLISIIGAIYMVLNINEYENKDIYVALFIFVASGAAGYLAWDKL